MRLVEIADTKLYHSTSDNNAIQILREGKMYPSEDALDDVDVNFISTSTNPSLLFFAGWTQTGNIQFVFSANKLQQLGYKLQVIPRFDEVRIILPESQEAFPITASTVEAVRIDESDYKYFKGWTHDLDFDTSWGQAEYDKLRQNELSPKGEFVGNKNPFGIIKMLADRRHIKTLDYRKPKR